MVPFFNTILNIFFPVYCISCGKAGEDLCLECLSNSPPAWRESDKWIFPLYDYQYPPVKKAISLLKYKNRKKIADVFGRALYQRILEELADLEQMENFREPILIPIPLSSKRKRERGFNQTELMCQKLVELDNNTSYELEKNILLKPKDTPHQARIENRSARLKNIIDSFSVKNVERIKSRNIILIDDVTTTGATLKEARKILKRSGAKKIIAFTVAH